MAVVTVTAGCPNARRDQFSSCHCTGECQRELTVEEKTAALRAEIARLETREGQSRVSVDVDKLVSSHLDYRPPPAGWRGFWTGRSGA